MITTDTVRIKDKCLPHHRETRSDTYNLKEERFTWAYGFRDLNPHMVDQLQGKNSTIEEPDREGRKELQRGPCPSRSYSEWSTSRHPLLLTGPLAVKLISE